MQSSRRNLKQKSSLLESSCREVVSTKPQSTTSAKIWRKLSRPRIASLETLGIPWPMPQKLTTMPFVCMKPNLLSSESLPMSSLWSLLFRVPQQCQPDWWLPEENVEMENSNLVASRNILLFKFKDAAERLKGRIKKLLMFVNDS